MATNTTNYSFQKPTVSGDSGVWGGYLNANWDKTDSLLSGGTSITGIDINSGAIDGTAIGANSASTGAFTSVAVDNITVDGQQITSTNTNGNIQLFANGTGYVELYGNTNAGAIRFNCESNSHGITIKGAPHSAAATYSLELPNALGSSGQVLSLSDGAGKLAFTSIAATTLGDLGITASASEINTLDALSRGSLIYGNSSAATAILTKGAADTVLTSDGTDISWAAPAPAGNVHSFTASGAVASGKPVILNTNGTVTQVSGQSESVGSEVVFENAQSYHILPIFDSSNNRVVIIYTDTGDSNYGKAIVGNVSGSSISYGTAATFNAATTYQISGTFDSNSNKVVIVYKDVGDSNKTNSIVGTVDPSDNSISFGSEATITTDVASDTTTTFDSNSNKVVTCYKNTSQSEYGYAAVGTVSGTSISYGTPVTFESAQVNMTQTSACFDSSNNKVVIAYRDVDNSGSATAIVGTVSGTSISFGTAVVVHSGQTETVVSTFDSVNNKVVVAYRENTSPKNVESVVGTVSATSISFGTTATVQSLASSYISDPAISFSPDARKVVLVYMDASTSNHGTYAVGSVSGTDITYETPVVFAAATTERNGICYDTNADKFVIAFEDGGNSNYGTSLVFQVASTNVTSTNFVGIANAAISDSAAGNITVRGGLITNSDLATLTIGSTYYVQDGGTLSTTTSSVVAGLALSATTLLLKGV